MLLDLYTIQKEQGKLENLTVVFVGDLKNSRTLHSLVPLLIEYSGNSFIFVSPKELRVPEELTNELSQKGISFTETENLDEALYHTGANPNTNHTLLPLDPPLLYALTEDQNYLHAAIQKEQVQIKSLPAPIIFREQYVE
jgi:hypothetical protein